MKKGEAPIHILLKFLIQKRDSLAKKILPKTLESVATTSGMTYKEPMDISRRMGSLTKGSSMHLSLSVGCPGMQAKEGKQAHPW